MEIYVVMGITGEYSDREEWPVCAFYDERKAKERVILASAKAKEIFAVDRYWEEETPSEYDKFYRHDYTGTTYYYHVVEVVE